MAVKSTIRQWAANEAQVASRAERGLAQVILSRSRMIAPHLTGALKEDGRVIKTDDGHSIVYGSDAVRYARRRHFENKKNPQTLHYLQRAGDSAKKEDIRKYYQVSR